MLLVHERQKGNPLLAHFRHVRWDFAAGLTSDFVVGATTCANYLSVKFHMLNSGYLLKRLRGVPKEGGFRLRLLLVHRDVEDCDSSLLEITLLCLAQGWTVLLAATLEEAARYLEDFKTFEHKPSSAIQERLEDTHSAQAHDMLTCIRSVNKTDATTVMAAFPTVASILTARREQLAQLPGVGDIKLGRLMDAFNVPFKGGDSAEEAEGGAWGAGGDEEKEQGVGAGT